MNWNGQRPYIDHFIATRSNPVNAGILQQDLNARRRKAIANACLTRPVYIPLRFDMGIDGQVSPYRVTTTALGYDVLIIGAKSDTFGRDIIVQSAEGERSFVRGGGSDNLYLKTDEFAGQIPGNGGLTGVQYFPSPLPLAQGRRMTVEMFKTDTTADIEVGHIVLIGIRVLSKAYWESVDATDGPLIDRVIASREFPQTFVQKIQVDFDSAIAGGQALNLLTDRIDDPCFIRGIRTSLRNSFIEIGFAGDIPWTIGEVPCWAIGAESEVVHDNWIWQPVPLYLPRNAQLSIPRVVNSINDVDLDAETGNTITFICQTV